MKFKSRKLFAILVITAMVLAMLPMTAFAATAATKLDFTVNPSPAGEYAGDEFGVTVQIQDVVGDLVDTATNAVTIAIKSGTGATGAVLSGTKTVNAVAGEATFSGLSIIKAGDDYVLTATATGLTAADSNSFDVLAEDENIYASSATISKTSIVADGTDSAKVTVYVMDKFYNPVEGVMVYPASSREDTDTFSDPAETNEFGKIEFTVKSNIAGTAKVGVGLCSEDCTELYLQGDPDSTKAIAQVIAAFDVTFTSAPGRNVTVTAAGGPIVADGLKQRTLNVAVTTSGGAPVANQAVTFSVNKSGLTWDKATYTTNVAGMVEAKVSSKVATTYKVRATSSGVQSSELDLVFTAAEDAYTVEIAGGNNQTVANTYESGWLTVTLRDVQGNKIANANLVKAAKDGDITFPTKPSGSNIAISTAAQVDEDTDNVKFKVTPDLVGEYVIRVAIANGQHVNFNLSSKEQGTITGLTLSYPQTYVAHDTKTANPTLKYVDAEGVARDANRTDMNWSVSNASLGSVDNGVFTATKDTKVTGTVTVTAVDPSRNLIASFNLTIGSVPSTVALEAAAPVTTVGENATVKLSLLNTDGNVVGFGTGEKRTLELRVIGKPAGSMVETSQPSSDSVNNALSRTGTLDFNVKSDTAGSVSVLAVVNSGDGVIISKQITVTFGEPKPEITGNVVMFIGSSGYVQNGEPKTADVAPFIEDGRTFVPVRFIAEAFGCEADWFPKDAAVETVTLTRNDIEVTITIGSYAITVVRDGVTETVVSDVAAFIRDGRTVLPLRAIGEIFGAEFDWGPKDAATEWVSFSL